MNRILSKIESLLAQRSSSVLDQSFVSTIHPDSLLFYFGNIHSQRGQDGILAEIFRRLNLHAGRFVEFGAWDGVYLSNCRFLFEKGWSGVFIEADRKRFIDLEKRYAGTRATCLNAMVGTTPGIRLCDLIDGDVSFVSIDVDGPDLDIFLSMGLKPPVVLLEGGFNFTPYLESPIPNSLAANNLQQPFAVIHAAALRSGYTPVCFYQDTYLVRTDLAAKFRHADAITLYREAFAFMPVSYRQAFLDHRKSSDVIRSIETEAFGHFSPDPLAY